MRSRFISLDIRHAPGEWPARLIRLLQKFSRRASLLDGWCWWWCRVVVYRDRDRDRVVVVSWASEANRSGFRFPGRCVEDDDSKRLGNVRRRKLHDA